MGGENRSRLSAGKHLVFIFTQGASDQAFKDIPEKYSRLQEYFNFASFNVIRGCGLFAPDQAAAEFFLQIHKTNIAYFQDFFILS